MPNRKRHYPSEIKTTKQGTFRQRRPGEVARKAEIYISAYKLALEQIPADQKCGQPNISLPIHASISRQLKAGETDAQVIAFAAVKEILVPDSTG